MALRCIDLPGYEKLAAGNDGNRASRQCRVQRKDQHGGRSV